MQILSNHTSPETAYVIEDYPYGFRLRCRMRYWLDYVPKKGFRLWSQTSNPKRGHAWNKPKASTFQQLAGCMILNADEKVTWIGLTEYDDVAACVRWRDTFGSTMPEDAQTVLKAWITRKLAYEQDKAEGRIKSTVTTTQYGCITRPNFGQPLAPPQVETTILTSDYTQEQRNEMGRTLRADFRKELQKL